MKKKKKHYKMIFTTRKSFFFIMSLIFLIFTSLSLFIIYLKNNEYMHSIISLMFACILVTFLFNNKIVLESYFIRVYFGIFIIKIKYKDIKSLYISDNHLPSFASSYHKVGIKTNRFKIKLFDVFVSPMDRDDFMYEVKNQI